MADPLSLIPAGSKFDTLRSMLKVLQRDFSSQYKELAKNNARVKEWVDGINAGKYTADDKRDDIVQYIVGKDRAMEAYGISEEEFNDLVLGSNEGGIDFADIGTGQSLNNVPGTPQVWKVGGTAYVVYTVPGTEDDPVYMSWEVPEGDLEALFGPDQEQRFNRTMTQQQFNKMGVLDFGTTDEIPASEKDPFATWSSEMEMQAQTQPWILDDDYQALMAMAMVEGRALSQSEIATTDWWQNHNKAQREWMALNHGDPSEAQRVLAENERQVEEMIRAAGGGDADPAIIKHIAAKWAHGDWSQTQVSRQIKALTDPHSNYELDDSLIPLVEEHPVDQTSNMEGRVRELLHTWLGPSFGGWSDAEIARQAGRLRNDPEAEQDFIESLKDQRMAVLPGYEDRELSYQAIANTWRQFFVGQWGQQPDETSDIWLKVLKNNDTEESGKLLRKEGYKRGVDKVINDLNSQTLRTTGGSERAAVYT